MELKLRLNSTNRCVPGLKTRLYEFRQVHAFYCVYTIQHQLRTLQWLPAFFLDYKTSLEDVTSWKNCCPRGFTSSLIMYHEHLCQGHWGESLVEASSSSKMLMTLILELKDNWKPRPKIKTFEEGSNAQVNLFSVSHYIFFETHNVLLGPYLVDVSIGRWAPDVHTAHWWYVW